MNAPHVMAPPADVPDPASVFSDSEAFRFWASKFEMYQLEHAIQFESVEQLLMLIEGQVSNN